MDDTNFKISKRNGDGLERVIAPLASKHLQNDNPEKMWEMKQLQYQGKAILDQIITPIEDVEGQLYSEEYLELELNQEEAPFLKGQTQRADGLS